tara:strand:+ start:252 stop:476 length:225 start_codon:yes stop_codon:yes gene_type:complete
MENIFNMVTGFFSKMTTLFMGLLSFGVMAEILFGSPVMGMSVIGNVMDVINMLGNNGVVGLIALVVLYSVLEKR